tara:strand:- start:137 stop:382 length:246 start_codon:yes stop_codon:yes gene_type:complete
MICAITKAKKRNIPITAIEPGEKNRFSEYAPKELSRLELTGCIFFEETFLVFILGGIYLECFVVNYSQWLLIKKVCKKRTN